MSNLIQQAILLSCRTPFKQIQRFRSKINIQNPKPPHYERAKILAATQPIYKKQPKTLYCFKPNRINEVHNPYNDIVEREVLNWLKHSRMVGIFHMNSITQNDLFRVRVQLHKQNMHLKSYGRNLIARAVEGSRFEAIVPLFEAQHCLVFSSEERLQTLFRIMRRVPQMILLAGIVDDTLLSRNELMSYAQIGSLQAGQMELVHTINMAANNLVQQLQTHQNNFVNVLDVYSKDTKTDANAIDKEATNEDDAKS